MGVPRLVRAHAAGALLLAERKALSRLLDAPARHYREEAARILGISEEEVSAVEAGFQGWDQDDHDPRWYEIGQWYAVQMGLECPEIAWPEERSELPSYEEWLRR